MASLAVRVGWAYAAVQHAAAHAHRAHAPARAATAAHLPHCELLVPTLHTLALQLHNYHAIAAFAGGYGILWLLCRRADARVVWALVLTLLAAAGIEVAEGMTKRGLCRVQDLAPAVAGVIGAAVLLGIWSRLRRKPAYVRIVKPRSAAARAAAAVPPRRPPDPLRGIPTVPVAGRAPVAPPPSAPDFSPGPSPVTEPTEGAPRLGVARTKTVQRLRDIVARIGPMFQRLWVLIRGRRRTAILAAVLVVVAGVGAFELLRAPTPAPVVPEQPVAAAPEPAAEAPPPPAPRPLAAQAEGYYEPSYEFTIAERRFTRLTLRPQASVRFSRIGSREDVACADARIGPSSVYLRCEFERVGTVTVDGRFASRYVSSQLDMPTLSAVITVTNSRGEVVYRARDSFYWHVPD